MKVIADQTVRYNGVSFTTDNELDIPEDLAKVWIEQKKAHKKIKKSAASSGKQVNKQGSKSGKKTAAVNPGKKPEEDGGEE